jgi:hypothetical protein
MQLRSKYLMKRRFLPALIVSISLTLYVFVGFVIASIAAFIVPATGPYDDSTAELFTELMLGFTFLLVVANLYALQLAIKQRTVYLRVLVSFIAVIAVLGPAIINTFLFIQFMRLPK